MTFSDSELFRQHYVSLEGPIRSMAREEPILKSRKTRSAPSKRKRKRPSSESESEASSVEYRAVQRRPRSSTASYVGEDDKLVAMEKSARLSAAPSRQAESESDDDLYPVPIPVATMEAVSAIMQYHAGSQAQVFEADFDVDKPHKNSEWRDHVLKLRARVQEVSAECRHVVVERDNLQKQMEHLQQYYHSIPNYEQELVQARTDNVQLVRDYQMLRTSFDDVQQQLREAQSEVRRAYLSKFEQPEEDKLQVPPAGIPVRNASPHRLGGEFYAANYHFSPNTAYLALSDAVDTHEEAGAWDALH